jgi:anti-sigma regulatory factor (Ser/Thr protein kinase)
MSADDLESLSESYAAVPGSVPAARNAVAAFAASAGATEQQIERIRLAASEALTNVVVHAYVRARGADPGRIHVNACVTEAGLWLLIADDGAGLHPRDDSPGLGMGLALIAHSSQELSVANRSSGGTEVRMRFPLGAGSDPPDDHRRGSDFSASLPASSSFSTTR